MRPALQQVIGLKQDMRMNPRLYQAMDLLYMPMLDLQQHLKTELLENPFLEMEEPDADTEAPGEVSDATPRPLVHGEPGDVVAIQGDFPLIRAYQAHNHIKRRCFSGTIGPE